MFTDTVVTPVRVEVMLDLLTKFPKGVARERLQRLLQPASLAEDPLAAKAAISAATQLELIEETDSSSTIILSKGYNKRKSPKQNLLEAADSVVLSGLDVEYYLALYYSYYLGLGGSVYERFDYSRDDWVLAFNKDVFKNVQQNNPFNKTKHTGQERWMFYFGLGWYDPSGVFQANPYERLIRALPNIFSDSKSMPGDDFMERLSKVCPELDGGDIFNKANSYMKRSNEEKQCSLGLSQALVDLHESEIIELDCPVDSRGWNIGTANPSKDDVLRSVRITTVKYRK